MSCLPFTSFTARAREAAFAIVYDGGILFDDGKVYAIHGIDTETGEEFEIEDGTPVRVFVDDSTPVASLCVFDLSGEFIRNAWPPEWDEWRKEAFREFYEGGEK